MILESSALKDTVEAITLNRFEDRRTYDDEHEADDADHDSAALLGPRSRTRGLERLPSTWDRVKSLITEATPALLLTTVSLTFTGELLDHVSGWRAMKELDQLIVVIPVVLNLNGNIEMNLSARLGTAANVGKLDDPITRRSMIVGNLALLQVQAISVSFVAAWVSLLLGLVLPHHSTSKTLATVAATSAGVRERKSLGTFWSRRPILRPSGGGNGKTDIYTIAMVAASAMSAASLSGLLLGSFMCTLTVLCRIFGLDPDNIAPPIASCLGDLTTLSLLGLVSNALVPFLHTPVPFIIFIIVTLVATISLYFTRHNPHVSHLLSQGWSPLFGAMVISSATGIILDLFVSKYEGFALLATVISGLPGAVGCIYASRLSTALHAAARKCGTSNCATLQDTRLPHTPQRVYPKSSPLEVSTRLTTITLLLVALPIEILFLLTLRALSWLHAPIIFVAFSILFFCFAAVASLSIARLLTNFIWKRGFDPDTYALPIHSAIMDLIGQTLLVICFEMVTLLKVDMRHHSR